MQKKKWTTIGELIDDGHMPFELFEKFKKGELVPYHRVTGKRIVDIDSIPHEPKQSFEDILNEETRVNNLRGGDAATVKVLTKPGLGSSQVPLDQPWTQAQVEGAARQKFESLPKYPVVPPGCIAESFTLSDDQDKQQQQIQQARQWIIPTNSVAVVREAVFIVEKQEDRACEKPPQEKTPGQFGKEGAEARWAPHNELMEQAVALAKKLWAEGDDYWHNEMADYILRLPEFRGLQETRNALLKRLKPVADGFGRTRGKKGVTKEKK